MSDVLIDDELETEPSFLDGSDFESVEPPHAEEAPAPKRGRGRPRKTESGKSDPQPDASKTKTPPTNKGGRPRKVQPLKPQLEVSLRFAAEMWAMGDDHCGPIMIEQSGKIAEALDNWAQSSPKIYDALSGTMKGSGALGVFLATMPVMVAIAQHHNPRAVAYRKAMAEQYAAQQAEEMYENVDTTNGPVTADVFADGVGFANVGSAYGANPGYQP